MSDDSKAIQFRLLDHARHSAAAALQRHVPWLDVQVFRFRRGAVLLPPHLLRALRIEYGPSRANAMLESAGLVDPESVAWREVIRWFQAHPDVWAEEEAEQAKGAAARCPADWHLTMCGVQTAWAAVGGPDHIAWGSVRGGQIDTGYTEHPVFGFPANPWIDVAAARTFIADPPPGAGHDDLNGGNGGHGTKSGSLLSGLDSTAPYTGVAPRLPLVPARINDCVIIDRRAREFEDAVRYLVDEADVKLINVSMATFLSLAAPRPIRRAVDHCYDRGVILVGAAGNVPAPEWPAFPAALPRAFAVAGVTCDAQCWSGSSYGSWVDFSAPAKDIPTAATAKSTGYGYAGASTGTTFAAAMTSGAAALWLLAHATEIQRRYRQPWQRVEAFREMARERAWTPKGWQPDKGFGAGVLNVSGLMDAARLPDPARLVKR